MAFLQTIHLSKHYPLAGGAAFQALKDVTISLDKGELVSIIGESGSGKSTLMNLIGGLDSQFEGEILVDGRKISTFTEKDFVQYRKEKVGFVFQSFNLVSHLSVLDNVTLAMTLSNVTRSARIDRAKQVLKELGLESQYHKKPNQLSGGQKQRVAIARALVNDPDIIIADEPTGSLDSQTTEQVLDIIEQIARSGKLVLMVTHSEKVAARSTRIITIDDGAILSDEKRQTLPAAPNDFRLAEERKSRNLNFFAAIRLALLNMKEKLARNILIALGGSIGIMSIIVMLSLGRGVNDYLTEVMMENVNPLVAEAQMPIQREEDSSDAESSQTPAAGPDFEGFGADGPQTGSAPAGVTQSAPFEEEDIAKLEAIDHVKDLEPAFTSFTFGSDSIAVNEEDQYAFIYFATTAGNMTEANLAGGDFPDEGEIMITEGMAQQMELDGYNVIGRSVTVEVTLNQEQITQEYTISGVYTEGSSGLAFDSVYVSPESLQTLSDENELGLEPNVIYLISEDAEYTQEIKDEVAELGYRGSSIDALASTFSQLLDIFTYILAGVAGISLFVSAIMILTVLYISVVERTQEIGVMKAIGGRRKDIRRIFVSESFLIGLFGGLLGVGFAALVCSVGNVIVLDLFDTTVLHMQPAFAGFGILTSILISVVAGLFPAQKAARLDPVEALRHE